MRQLYYYLAPILGIFSLGAAALGAIVQLQGLNLPYPETRGKTTVPLSPLAGGQVFAVDVKVGKTIAPFLLDTGASTTMVATALAEELQLVGEAIPGDRVNSAVAGDECPEMNATLHRLPPMALGDVRVMELQGLEFEAAVIPDELSGVLGMDVLGEFDVEIDPRTRQLRLLPPSELPPELSSEAIPLRSRLGVMVAEVAVADEGPFTFMLDTGAETIFISEASAGRLDIDPSSRSDVQILGFCGLEMATRSTLKTVRLGSKKLDNLEVVILPSPSVLDLLEVDGIIGQTFLAEYRQYWRFDPSRSRSEKWGGSLLLTR